MPTVLDTIARHPNVATLLPPVATIALTTADTPESIGLATLYTAVGAALTGDTDTATQLTQQAATAAPEQKPTWITLLANLAATTPQAITLIPHLTQTTPTESTQP